MHHLDPALASLAAHHFCSGMHLSCVLSETSLVASEGSTGSHGKCQLWKPMQAKHCSMVPLLPALACMVGPTQICQMPQQLTCFI